MDKSSILFSKNTHTHIKNQIVQVFGLKETEEFGMYLGVPLTGLHPRVKHYQYLIDKVRALASYKGKHISYVVRVTLAKTMIEALPTYTMMSNKTSTTCLKEIHKTKRNFIWDHSEHDKN